MKLHPSSARRDLFGWEDLKSEKHATVTGPLFENHEPCHCGAQQIGPGVLIVRDNAGVHSIAACRTK
jgi:hypothetical protein